MKNKFPTMILFFLLTSCTGFYLSEEEVLIQNQDIELSGTLSLPKRFKAPYPLVVIVHGSGNQTRANYGLMRKLVLDGVAVFTYDKRGCGKSGGQLLPYSIEDSPDLLKILASDVISIVQKLKTRQDIDNQKIGLIGSSQGGWIIPIAANRENSIKFIISLSGPSATAGEEDYYSELTGENTSTAPKYPPEQINELVEQYTGIQGFDPTSELEQLKIPSYWLFGMKDESIPVKKSIENLQKIMALGNGQLDIKTYPLGNHSFQNINSGKLYDFIEDIRKWLKLKGFSKA